MNAFTGSSSSDATSRVATESRLAGPGNAQELYDQALDLAVAIRRFQLLRDAEAQPAAGPPARPLPAPAAVSAASHVEPTKGPTTAPLSRAASDSETPSSVGRRVAAHWLISAVVATVAFVALVWVLATLLGLRKAAQYGPAPTAARATDASSLGTTLASPPPVPEAPSGMASATPVDVSTKSGVVSAETVTTKEIAITAGDVRQGHITATLHPARTTCHLGAVAMVFALVQMKQGLESKR